MRTVDPSDLTREPFKTIRPQLESVRKPTRPRLVDLYDVFGGILYILKGGIQWRMLPGDVPNWRTIHEYCQIWSKPGPSGEPSLLEPVMAAPVIAVRTPDSRSPQTSLIIVDAPSVKNADTAAETGSEADKIGSVIKRPLAVATQGLPPAIPVTTANINDRAAALDRFQPHPESLSSVALVLVAGGYTGDSFAEAVQAGLEAMVEVVTRSALHQLVVRPKRWVVERSFAWLEQCQRLWQNCERHLNTSLQLVVLTFRSLLLKKF